MTEPADVFYVNRNTNNRKRHVDPNCRGLELARKWLEIMYDEGYYDGFEEREGVPPPTAATRFVEVRPRDAEELAALEAFTTPCTLCVPGARELLRRCPVDFEGG